MNPNELRIGNLIFDDFNDVHVVERLESKKYNDWNGSDPSLVVFSKLVDEYNGMYTCDVVSAIPITEEWLIKLGFEKSDYPNFTRKVSALTMTCRIQIGINYSEFGGVYFADKFKYVHEIQNFIFSVSGQELCVTQP